MQAKLSCMCKYVSLRLQWLQTFLTVSHLLQPLRKRFGIAYLEKARLGQVWQPWYADLLKQGGLTGVQLTGLAHA